MFPATHWLLRRLTFARRCKSLMFHWSCSHTRLPLSALLLWSYTLQRKADFPICSVLTLRCVSIKQVTLCHADVARRARCLSLSLPSSPEKLICHRCKLYVTRPLLTVEIDALDPCFSSQASRRVKTVQPYTQQISQLSMMCTTQSLRQ